MNSIDSGEVKRPQLLALALSFSLSSGTFPDGLLLSYFAGNQHIHLHPKLAVTRKLSGHASSLTLDEIDINDDARVLPRSCRSSSTYSPASGRSRAPPESTPEPLLTTGTPEP
jgi:hypothetical protein